MVKVQVICFNTIEDIHIEEGVTPSQVVHHLYAKAGYAYDPGWYLVSKNTQKDLRKNLAFSAQGIKDGDVLILKEVDT